MKKLPIASIAATAALLLLASQTPILADQYGNSTPDFSLRLNKLVQDPKSGNFVENLGISTPLQAGDDVTFRVEITNTGKQSFSFIDVKDTLPNFLDFVSGPGTFNKQGNVITFRLENFTPGKTETRDIKLRVVGKDMLPSNTASLCIVNAATATTNTNQTVTDTAQICIGTPIVTTPPQLPKTGPLLYLILMAGGLFFATLTFGLLLRRAKH